ncbi:YrdB family protein [Falsibacillus pallidus]|uniref:YrdB family protein n=1 Tax=Falsibacillus pallidus TaxID=493781 RepID=UPI003D983A38
MSILKGAIAGVFFFLELAALISLGYWGFTVDKGFPMKLVLGIGAPLAAAFIWGAFVAPKAEWLAALPVKILLQILVFGSAGIALYGAGHGRIAVAYMVIAAIEILLMHTMKI